MPLVGVGFFYPLIVCYGDPGFKHGSSYSVSESREYGIEFITDACYNGAAISDLLNGGVKICHFVSEMGTRDL